MRMTDEPAARRCLYPRPLPTAPAVMLIDIPRQWAGPGLLLGRYRPTIIETDEEWSEFETLLTAPRAAATALDLLTTRPSNLRAAAITFIEFVPPAAGWPWVLLCHWPADLAAIVGAAPDVLARGAYTIEAYRTHRELLLATAKFAGMLGGSVTVRSLTGHRHPVGHA